MPLTQSTIFRPPSPHPKPPLRPAPLQRFTPSPLSPANAPSSPERATDYRRGQAMRSPRSRVPQQITPPWGGAGVGTIRHSSFIIGSGVWRLSGGYASLTPVCNLPPPRGFSGTASANPCVKGQRDGRDQGTFTCASLLPIVSCLSFQK